MELLEYPNPYWYGVQSHLFEIPSTQIANNNIVQDITATVYLNFVYERSCGGVIQLRTAISLTSESNFFKSTTRQNWTRCYLYQSLVQLTFNVLGIPIWGWEHKERSEYQLLWLSVPRIVSLQERKRLFVLCKATIRILYQFFLTFTLHKSHTNVILQHFFYNIIDILRGISPVLTYLATKAMTKIWLWLTSCHKKVWYNFLKEVIKYHLVPMELWVSDIT